MSGGTISYLIIIVQSSTICDAVLMMIMVMPIYLSIPDLSVCGDRYDGDVVMTLMSVCGCVTTCLFFLSCSVCLHVASFLDILCRFFYSANFGENNFEQRFDYFKCTTRSILDLDFYILHRFVHFVRHRLCLLPKGLSLSLIPRRVLAVGN